MLRHLLKLMWNKKRAHSLLVIEIWASFMVLFGVLSLIVYNLRNYLQPLGYQYDNVWVLDLSSNQDTTAIAQKIQTVLQRVRSYPEVEIASRSNNSPFSFSQMSNRIDHKKRNAQVDMYVTDEYFAPTIDLPIEAGRWFQKGDLNPKFAPIVLNKAAVTELFENENPVGQLIKRGDKPYKVIGVVSSFKDKGEFKPEKPFLFELLDQNSPWNSTIVMKVKPGTDASFEARLVKDVALMAKDWGVEVTYLTEARKKQNNTAFVPIIIFVIISAFLLINVALGLFGVLNLSIAKRKNEIGVRRAMGATENRISTQFVGEIWVLATFALLIGLLFAFQFPLLNVFNLDTGVYLTAIALATVVIYAIVTLCALFPSRQAARIHPAVALHEE